MNTPQTLCAHFAFHPVGQGLFASGTLFPGGKYCLPSKRNFSWVYDCGTASSQKFIDRELQRLSLLTNSIDLLTISHFDADHISGIARLLKKCSVKNLLLPYAPLWQRLLIAFGSGIAITSSEFGFFLNPVSYLRSLNRDDENLGRIILVPGSMGNSRPPESEGRNLSPDSQWEILIDTVHDGSESSGWTDWEKEQFPGDSTFERMVSGSSIRVNDLWEFVPYNDIVLTPPPTPNGDFQNAVEVCREQLLDPGVSLEDLQDNLDELKKLYDEEFGDSGEERNDISLYLYAGPIARKLSIGTSVSGTFPEPFCFFAPFEYHCGVCDDGNACTQSNKKNDGKVGVDIFGNDCYCLDSCRGILYTGDGNLSDKNKLDRLTQYLLLPRSRKILCLQVMHHGSEKSWHQGVARKLDPYISAFCSEPNDNRYRHPDPKVWSAFRHRGRRQINSDSGLLICMRYE